MNIKILSTATVYMTIIVFALSLISLFGRYPYVELTTHFRLQYVLAAMVCVVVLSLFGYWKFVPLAVLTLVFNLYFVVPYYLSPTETVATDVG